MNSDCNNEFGDILLAHFIAAAGWQFPGFDKPYMDCEVAKANNILNSTTCELTVYEVMALFGTAYLLYPFELDPRSFNYTYSDICSLSCNDCGKLHIKISFF